MKQCKSKDKKSLKKTSFCTVCRKPATRLVDGEPSCEQHANLIYENQLEDYTREHLTDGDWKEKTAAAK
ncbi:MAG TPA: hypothetical protein VH437_08920 [Terriglobales bacterium]|jgi:hypothetical protein